jgi:hypothetical protein
MFWRTLVGLAVLVSSARGQKVALRETVKTDDCFRVTLAMKLKGEIRFERDGKKKVLPLQAEARHAFPERVLSVSADRLADRVVRRYSDAGADIKVDDHASKKSLREGRRLIVSQAEEGRSLCYSPAGVMTRSELELVSEHLDTLHLPGLLPGKDVAVGDAWAVPAPVVRALCHFDAVGDHAVKGKLESVRDGSASFRITGKAKGVELGALVKIEIDAVGTFDVKAGRLVKLEWKQKDEREQGPANPESKVETTTTLTRTPVERPEELSDAALKGLPAGFKVPEYLTYLEFVHAKKVYDLTYPREWYTSTETANHLILRLIERSEFLAQATITPWTTMSPGKHLSPDEFATAMENAQGWKPEKDLQANEVPGEKGQWIYRLSQQGKLDGVEVIQTCFLIAHEDGRQVVVVLQMSPKNAARIGTRDFTLAGSLTFPKK